MPLDLKLCRSLLFLPASNPRAIEKARGLDADLVVLDLEDAVKPEDKARARAAAVEAAAASTAAARARSLSPGFTASSRSRTTMSAPSPRAFSIARALEAGRKSRDRQSLRSAIMSRFRLEEVPLARIMLPLARGRSQGEARPS